MHQAIAAVAPAAAQITGHLLSAGPCRFQGEISTGGGHHQIAAVIEYHRHHQGPFNAAAGAVADGESAAASS